MSKYTTEIRYICENAAGLKESSGYNDVNGILVKAAPNIFTFDFPIFDENYRMPLEIKILKHYYTREIGAETAGLWKLWLDAKMNEIMPYYNQLYKSELYEFNPLYDTDITTTHSGKRNDNRDINDSSVSQSKNSLSSNGSSNDTAYSLFSDTPQGGLSGVDDQTYLTTVTKNTDNYSNNNNSNSNGESSGTYKRGDVLASLDEYTNHVVGIGGSESYSKKLSEFRKTFLNIDMQIINELSNLFMNVW